MFAESSTKCHQTELGVSVFHSKGWFPTPLGMGEVNVGKRVACGRMKDKTLPSGTFLYCSINIRSVFIYFKSF